MIYIAGAILLVLVTLALVALPLIKHERKGEAVFASVFVIGSAIGLYLLIGRPDLGLEPPAPASADMQPQDIEAMIDQLAARLEANPDDAQGWTMLGRSYVVVGRFDAAARAFAEAQARTPEENPDLLASFAEARALANPAGLESEIGALFDRVLELDPGNQRGLWYGGLAAQARGDTQTAVVRWRGLLQNELPPEFRQLVERQVAALEGEATGVLLYVDIEVAPEIADRIPPGGVLYLFARVADAPVQGPPLAARRVEQADPPLRLALTRAHLLGGDALPNAELEIGARISATPDPAPAPGDIEGFARWHPSGEAGELQIVLDTQRGN